MLMVIDEANGGAQALYEQLSANYSPYTIKTIFIRVGELYSFIYPAAVNPFKAYVQTNARLFKHVYTRREVECSYPEAVERISMIADNHIRELANFMLHTGCRSMEALQYDGSGTIVGKGGKPRKIVILKQLSYPKNHNISYSVLHKALAAVGLKPHTLRKLYATKLVEGGLREADLMQLMGWSDIQTAAVYFIPKNEETLTNRLEQIFGN